MSMFDKCMHCGHESIWSLICNVCNKYKLDILPENIIGMNKLRIAYAKNIENIEKEKKVH